MDYLAQVLKTIDGKLISQDNPLPVAMVGGSGGVDMQDYYTKEESDDKFQAKGSYATVAQVDSKATQADLTTLQQLVSDLQAEIEALKTESGIEE